MTLLGMMTQKEVMEQALFHLMYQSRQIHQKYGLMVNNEVTALYQKSDQCINVSKEWMKQLDKLA